MSVSIHDSCLFLCTVLVISKTLLSFLFLLPHVNPLQFNYTSFDQPDALSNIICSNDSSVVNGGIQLTSNRQDRSSQHSVGRASYARPLYLWNNSTKKTTNFTTHFSFEITQLGNGGDGITFFLAPFNNFTAFAPNASDGGFLGLVSGDITSGNYSAEYPFVAVEFDTFRNQMWDPEDIDNDHLGIDVNSLKSKVYAPWGGKGVENETTANVWITYDSATQNLSVYLTYDANPVFNGQSSLSSVIDLSSILPEKVRVGFSSTTGSNLELHHLISWDFDSTSLDIDVSTPPPPLPLPSSESLPSKNNSTLVVGLVASISILAAGMAFVFFMCWRKRSRQSRDNLELMDYDFDQATGPKRFTYDELSFATNNFHEQGKLGEGGFGGVYRGFLTELQRDIAVKKISKGSKQGEKEYVSEVKIISRLRHKNLVQLLGWCHEKGDLLLVYEFMPNGSLDSHLYAGKEITLPWALRYKIAQDLASALLYLHQEWEQCVLHRDIKTSNVMLDSNFNAKLGDFGLARLVDHNLGSQTTIIAGTLGYLAPECVMTGKFSKESDVYSYGMVALEIASGRPPVLTKEEPASLLEWVWHLYGEGHLREAIDEKLVEEFDIQQIECLMVVGLWCCHPDYTCRPSIRQVINVLSLESPLPTLPMKIPVPIYVSPQTSTSSFYITSSSSGLTNSSGGTSSSSRSVPSGSAPLLSGTNV